MKLPVSEHHLESNVEETYEVTIGQEESSIILAFLRDNIYSDPIKASVKETLSNSVDVHVEYKVDRPIEITTPNSFNPNLTIRDFGPGLSKEFMKTKYVRAGCSTKRNNNLTMGGWGIGRLAPLSYTDVYYVDSFTSSSEGNIKSSYAVNVYDEAGQKKVSLFCLNEELTNEPTGLKVTIPVKIKDKGLFEVTVNEHCSYLHKQPPFINNVPAKTCEKLLEGKDGSWYTVKNSGFKGHITFLIGGMPNEISNMEEYTTGIFNRYTYSSSSSDYTYLKYLDLVINIPIGSVTQTASKDIQKGNLTNKTLTELCNKAHNEIIQVYQEKLDQCSSLDEACNLIYNFSKRNSLKWKDLQFTIYDSILLRDCTISCIRKRRKSLNLYYEHLDSLPIKNDTKCYIKDIKGVSIDQLYQYTSKQNNIYFITPCNKETFTNYYNFELLSNLIPVEELENNLNKKQPTIKRKVDRSLITAYELRSDRSLLIACSTNKVRVPKEPTNITYYLPLTEDQKKIIERNEYYQEYTCYKTIYLIEESKKLQSDNWVNFNDHVSTKIKEFINSCPAILDFVLLEEYTQYPLSNILRFNNLPDGDIKENKDYIKELESFYYSLSTKDKFLLKIYLKNNPQKENQLLNQIKALENKYPLLLKWSNSNSILTDQEVHQYIQQVNNK